MKDFNLSSAAFWAQTAEILRDEDAYLERIAEAWLTRNMELSTHHAFRVPITSFLALPVALRRRVIRQ